MTQYPTDPPSFPYQPGYQQPIAPQRPTSVTVIAIIGIVLGALGVLCIGGGTIMTILGKSFSTNGQSPAELPAQARSASIVLGVVGLLLWGLLLVGSIGALMLQEWARKLLIGVSIVDLLYGVVKLVINIMVVLPATLELMQQHAAPNQPANMASIMRGTMYATAVIFWVVSAVFPIVTLVIMRKRDVVAAFRSDQPAAM